MSLSILYIAYPLLTVSEESAGGAEQVLWTLEREMSRRGQRTTVAASEGSCVSGELFPTGAPCTTLDDFERRNREHQEQIVELVRGRARQGRGFDLVHDMSGSFWIRAAEMELPGLPGLPVLATLHLPRSFYPAESFENIAPNVSFNCVSQSQAGSFTGLASSLDADMPLANVTSAAEAGLFSSSNAGLNACSTPSDTTSSNNPRLPEVAPNGIALDRFARLRQSNSCEESTRRGLLWLGRICEEKAPHLALDIAARAGLPIILAGKVYPFSYHQQYFEREIAPRLREMPEASFISSPPLDEKLRLLGEAQALLITSQAEETSSLVAMEAAAMGTPVIAFRRGALPEVVRDEVTGFVVENAEEATAACRRISLISSASCMAWAQENFSSARMAEGYLSLYARVLSACGTIAVPA